MCYLLFLCRHKKWHLLSPSKLGGKANVKRHRVNINQMRRQVRMLFYARCDIVNGGKLKIKSRKSFFRDLRVLVGGAFASFQLQTFFVSSYFFSAQSCSLIPEAYY